MSRLYYIVLFLVITLTKLIITQDDHTNTIENVQNHKHHLSKSSLIHCGYRYCYSTDILYRKMKGLYCWNKTEIIAQYTSTSRTCSPTVFNVPITTTIRKKYRPTPMFHRKKLKHHTTTMPHKQYTSRPRYAASTATTTTTTTTTIPLETPTLFSISEKLINEDRWQQLKKSDDFIIVEEDTSNERNNEIDRDNSDHYTAADSMRDDNNNTDLYFQKQQQNDTDGIEYNYDANENIIEDDDENNDDTIDQDTIVEEQEDDESDEPVPASTTLEVISTPPPTTPDDGEDDYVGQNKIPIISAAMQPIIPGAIIPESPQDPNGGSVLGNLNEMAVNNNVPNKALGIGLGIGVGCIAALGLVGLLFHSKKKNKGDDEPSGGKQYTRWRPQSFMGVVASVVSKLPRSPSQRSKASSSGRAIDSSTSAPSLAPVGKK